MQNIRTGKISPSGVIFPLTAITESVRELQCDVRPVTESKEDTRRDPENIQKRRRILCHIGSRKLSICIVWLDPGTSVGTAVHQDHPVVCRQFFLVEVKDHKSKLWAYPPYPDDRSFFPFVKFPF